MDADAVIGHIRDELDDVAVVESSGDSFFFHEHGDRTMPFATVVTGDRGADTLSDLDRDGAFRLSIGLTTATYRAMFGTPPRARDEHGVLDTGFDPAERDRIVPHPYYASQHWVCVVSPSEATFGSVRPLLAEAHAFATRKAERRARRGESRGESRSESRSDSRSGSGP